VSPEICVCRILIKIHPNSVMKIPTSRRSRGFTLIELLVVITIIAVLAAAGFGAGAAAIQKAKKTTAQSTAVALESAVNNFFTEYGSMPSTGTADADVKTNSKTGVELITVLLGKEKASDSMLNTRAINFLSVKTSKDKPSVTKPKDGLVYEDSGAPKGLYDPWGGGYSVMLDLDFDEQVKPAPSGGGTTTLQGKRVAVWSNGADGVVSGGKVTDDVKTW
jgi:prepilin-type N-terminal cleavage/methylation domain-containing protein